MNAFEFNDYDRLSDGEIEIVLKEKQPAPPGEGYVPQYHFDICLPGKAEPIGSIRLRIGNTELITEYAGHIGYGINEEYRGHRYASKACNLVKAVALDHGFETCWIMCEPDNIASRRTCETIGAKFIEIVHIPENHDLYQRGERQKCRYQWDLTTS